MDDVKIYCSDASAVNPIEHQNYAEILQHTEKMQHNKGKKRGKHYGYSHHSGKGRSLS